MSDKFLLVASDVHSDSEVFEYLAQIASSQDCIAFLYAGDLDVENYFVSNALRNRNFTFLPVLGNCDSPYSYTSADIPIPTTYRNYTCNSIRIFMTHGHLYNMPHDVGLNDEDFDIVINGHTHISEKSTVGDLIILNPGSASKPRGFSEKSYVKIVFTQKGPEIRFERIPDQCSH